MIIADIAILPIGIDGTELGDYVAVAVETIKKSGIKYQLNAMGTLIESEFLDEIYSVIQNVQEAIFDMGINRVYTVIKIDDRRDKSNRTLEDKVNTIENLIN
ncbi:MAG: MTH1187 family thiamine-binding protein [Methanobrevibacter sp.]|jgi:uncharacterized protein (TIGR00106 family)|nr:MTH1187 family thiamine-binding protein [Candidatus Methanoflexus mossambicus]